MILYYNRIDPTSVRVDTHTQKLPPTKRTSKLDPPPLSGIPNRIEAAATRACSISEPIEIRVVDTISLPTLV